MVASGLKKIVNGDFDRRVFIEKESCRKMKYSSQVESVLDLIGILIVESKNDHVQSFSTNLVQTIIAMKKTSSRRSSGASLFQAARQI